MKSIKDKIRQHLAKVTEATAKKIGAAIGMKDYPSDVVKALSEMRTDAEVECEKRKGQGNEYWYWLTNVTTEYSTNSEQISRELVEMPVDKETRQIKPPKYDPDAVCFDPEKKALSIAVRNHNLIGAICAAVGFTDDQPLETLSAFIADRIADAGKSMPTDKECCNAAKVVATTAGSEVASLREQLANAEKQRDSHFATSENYASQLQIAERAVTSWIELAGEFECKGVAEFRIFVHSLSKRVDEFKAELGHARIQIAALNEQLMAGEEAVDVKDAAKGYLVCAPKRKPAKLMKAESAVARAKSAAKATGRCEVFALVPVGIATRKQIQAVEFKERVA